MMAMQKAECRVFIREIREIRGSIPLVAAGRAVFFVVNPALVAAGRAGLMALFRGGGK